MIEADPLARFHEIMDLMDEFENTAVQNMTEDQLLRQGQLQDELDELDQPLRDLGLNPEDLGKSDDDRLQREYEEREGRTIEGEAADVELDEFGVKVGMDPDGEPIGAMSEYFSADELADPDKTLADIDADIVKLEAEVAESQQEGDENSADVLLDDINVQKWFRNQFVNRDNVTDIAPTPPTSLENAAVIANGLVDILDLIDTLFAQGNMAEGILGQEGAQKIIDNLKEGMTTLVPATDDAQTTEAAARVQAAIDAAERRLAGTGPTEVAPVPSKGAETSMVVGNLQMEMNAQDAAEILKGIKVIKDDGTQGTFQNYNFKAAIDFEGRDPTQSFARPSKKWRLAPGQSAEIATRVEAHRARPAEPQPIPPTTTPPKVIDVRLRRQSYRGRLLQMSDEIQHGGGNMGTLNREETYPGEREADGQATGTVISRSPSENPEWFQSMVEDPELKMSVKQVQAAVNSAIAGKRKLGVRQAKVIQHMLDLISGERDEQVDYAKAQLEKAREARQDARADAGLDFDPFEDIRGEVFQEDEYADDMTADSRIIYEMMAEATELGVSEDVLEALAIKHTENQPFMDALQEQIDEQRHFRSAQADEAKQSERTDADNAPDAPARKPVKRKKLTAIQQHAFDKFSRALNS